MISCQDADVLAAALSVGSLDSADHAALQQHLVGCASCRRLAGEYMAAAARLPLALEPLQPPPELRGRLMRAVYREAAERAATRQSRPPWWQRFWAAVPTGRGFTLAAAAAVLVLAAGGTWAALRGPAAQPNPATVAVAMVATSAAPSAHGRLVYTPSARQAVLTVSGLPAPQAIASGDTVYEVWLVRADGAVAPAAYLSQEPDGTWSAAMHGDMSGYAAVATTAEPRGGSLMPTGAKVLEGLLAAPAQTGASSGPAS